MMQLFTKTSSCIKQVRSTRPITGSRLGSPRCISIYIPKTHFTSFFDKKRPYFGWLILQNRGHSSIYTPVETIYIYIYMYTYIYIYISSRNVHPRQETCSMGQFAQGQSPARRRTGKRGERLGPMTCWFTCMQPNTMPCHQTRECS